MKRSNNFIPALIALTVSFTTAESLQAQAPARQAFPWSSGAVAQSESPAVSQSASRVSASAQHLADTAETLGNSVSQSISNTIDNATSIANHAASVGETIYLDESGNQITREQMQAKLSEVHRPRQDFQNHVPSQPVDNSVWAKAKNMTSKASSFWKKPSLFKKPEGLNLPSNKSTWGKPKFAEPTTWFSKKAASPITFAPIDSLPRRGKIPTSIDGPVSQHLYADRSVDRLPPNTNVIDSSDSVFEAAQERVASEFNSVGDFNPKR